MVEDEELSFTVRAIKRWKIDCIHDHNNYLDIRYLFPTSNVCERLPSKAGYLFNENRKGVNSRKPGVTNFFACESGYLGASGINKLSIR